MPEYARVAVGEIGVISAKQFIRAIAREGHGHVLAAHVRKKPDGKRAGVGAGLIGVSGELLDGALKIGLGVEVELMMIGLITRGDLPEILSLVETAAPEGNRKR